MKEKQLVMFFVCGHNILGNILKIHGDTCDIVGLDDWHYYCVPIENCLPMYY